MGGVGSSAATAECCIESGVIIIFEFRGPVISHYVGGIENARDFEIAVYNTSALYTVRSVTPGLSVACIYGLYELTASLTLAETASLYTRRRNERTVGVVFKSSNSVRRFSNVFYEVCSKIKRPLKK